MRTYVEPIAKLVEAFRRLPGIGSKSAQRLAFHILMAPDEEVDRLIQALAAAKREVKNCQVCGNLTDQVPCRICSDQQRDQGMICVVHDPRDVAALEKTREFRGTYHVLHGAISPMDGIGPDELSIKPLLGRLQHGGVEEVILATDPTVEGEATALYLARLIKPLGIRVTRIAHGLPVGGDLEYADEVTLARALEGRREV